MFIYGMSALTRTATVRHREEHPDFDTTYERMVNFVKYEGNSARAKIMNTLYPDRYKF